jgi:hypothetical protein
MVMRIESAVGVITAAPTPCTARAAISAAGDHASPHRSDAAVKKRIPIMNMRRRPSRSAERPPSSRRPPKVSAYALITHWSPCAEKPRSFSIDGSATITIAASRITMKKAPQRRASAHQLRESVTSISSPCVVCMSV